MLRFLTKLSHVGGNSGFSKFLSWLPNNLQSLRTFSILLFTTGFIALLLMRLSQCLPQYKMKRKKKLCVFNIRTMVIFGSGVAPPPAASGVPSCAQCRIVPVRWPHNRNAYAYSEATLVSSWASLLCARAGT
jgi:hypothetical protein